MGRYSWICVDSLPRNSYLTIWRFFVENLRAAPAEGVSNFKLAGNSILKIQTPAISARWTVLLEESSPELVPEASFSQADSCMSHGILCCGLVAVLALILCEVLFLHMKIGNSPWQNKPG